MSNPVSTVDETPAASGGEEPSPQDGWQTGGLPALRAELDRIDDAVHDLLMQRAEIVEHVARSGKPAAFRPGREASIIRRLLGRHQGALPPGAIVRIWRELLAGTTAMQGTFSLAVCDTQPGVPLTQLAREHFGALTPLRTCPGHEQALAAVAQGQASVAVLPFPSDADDGWLALLRHEPRLYVIGRLPFWQARSAGAPAAEALVIAATPPDASEDDRSLIAMTCDAEVSRVHVIEHLATAGLQPETVVLAGRHVLAEVDGSVADDDARLGHLGSALRQPVVLGHYAVPIAGVKR